MLGGRDLRFEDVELAAALLVSIQDRQYGISLDLEAFLDPRLESGDLEAGGDRDIHDTQMRLDRAERTNPRRAG